MLARVQSYLLVGVEASPCEVEVDLDDTAMEKSTLVGLPDAAVKESLQRVRSALANSGYLPPAGATVVNLAPADQKKEGPLYDLPIAVGLLVAMGVIQSGPRTKPGVKPGPAGKPGAAAEPAAGIPLQQCLIAGELALDGRLRPIRGVIAMADLARRKGIGAVIVPQANVAEAAVVHGVDAIGCATLSEVVGVLNGQIEKEPEPPIDVMTLLTQATAPVDFADVRGQESVKRAITIAAAGMHNLVMLGPAGTGKSMMAKALPGVLPPLEPGEAVEVTRIYSAAGLLPPGVGLLSLRPVRTPHHTASAASIVGGGMIPRPGEISLSHHGVLFLDELPEFPRDVLETLRQPLEDHVVTISRAQGTVRFPADFMLVAALNPTAKGDMPTGPSGQREMDRYLSKLSGPLIDRIDMHVEAPAVPFKQLSATNSPPGTSSKQMRQQVLGAREVQRKRQGPGKPNSRLSSRELDAMATMSEPARTLLGQSISELGLSARAYDKIRRVARTIADLEGAGMLEVPHVAEAIQYRLLDRKV